MWGTVFAMLFGHLLLFGFCDAKKFIVSARVAVEGKNATVICGPVYSTEGLGYRGRDGEILYIPVDGERCYACGPCAYRTGMICTRKEGECATPTKPSEQLNQRLGHGRAIISINEASPTDEIYTGVLDPKTRTNEYKVEPAPPIANLDPDILRKFFQDQGSGDGSGSSGGSGKGGSGSAAGKSG